MACCASSHASGVISRFTASRILVPHIFTLGPLYSSSAKESTPVTAQRFKIQPLSRLLSRFVSLFPFLSESPSKTTKKGILSSLAIARGLLKLVFPPQTINCPPRRLHTFRVVSYVAFLAGPQSGPLRSAASGRLSRYL